MLHWVNDLPDRTFMTPFNYNRLMEDLHKKETGKSNEEITSELLSKSQELKEKGRKTGANLKKLTEQGGQFIHTRKKDDSVDPS